MSQRPGTNKDFIEVEDEDSNYSDEEFAFEQKESHYVPMPYFSARLLLEKSQPVVRHMRGRVHVEVPRAQPIEIEQNPIYLRSVREDVKHTRPGQPFHPVFAGSTRQLREQQRAADQHRFLVQQPIEDVLGQQQQRASSSPAGARARGLPSGRQHLHQKRQPFLANPNFNAPIGSMRPPDPFRPQESASFGHNMTDPLTGSSRGLGGSLYEMQLSSYVQMRQNEDEFLAQGGSPSELGAFDPSRTTHARHTIRNACTEAVDLVRALLMFRNVDTKAQRGPHREVFLRFMDVDFLQDIQWLLKTGLYLIKYPQVGVSGAVHYRHFTIWMLPWSPDPQTPPRPAPFLVWRSDDKSRHANGRVPLCNFLGATRDINDSKVLKRYAEEDGLAVKGPIYDNMKRTLIPRDNVASLWFLCQVTGGTRNPDGTVTSDLGAKPLGDLNSETSDVQQHQQQQQQREPRFQPGGLGRINVDVACRDRPSLERFLRVMDGFAALNEVQVQRRDSRSPSRTRR